MNIEQKVSVNLRLRSTDGWAAARAENFGRPEKLEKYCFVPLTCGYGKWSQREKNGCGKTAGRFVCLGPLFELDGGGITQ